MIDLHTHLLPGIDDGARTAEQAAAVLERFAADGVEVVACTPHVRASRLADAPVARRAEARAELDAALAGRRAPRLLLGFEVMLDAPEDDLAALAIEGSDAVLVEFPRIGVPARGALALARLRARGLRPIVAHAERYWGATPALLRSWRAAGAMIQTDAAELGAGGPRGRMARLLLEEGLVDCLASDNHGDGRSLATARRWLQATGADEHAELLTRENPRRALAGEAPSVVPPLRVGRGALARLRDALLGRPA